MTQRPLSDEELQRPADAGRSLQRGILAACEAMAAAINQAAPALMALGLIYLASGGRVELARTAMESKN